MTMKNIIRLLALVAILTAIALPASAQWGPEEEKNCFLNGKKGTITLSGQSNSAQGDSSKLEQFEEIPNGFLVPCAAYGWSNEKYFFDAKAIDALYDDQFLGATFGKKGGFQLDFTWDENPNWQSNTARTPYTETSPGVFDIPDATRLALQNVYVPWVTPTATNPVGTGTAPANPTVPGFYAVENFVNTGLPTFDLRYVRKTGRVGFSVPVGQAFLFDASYSREKRDGNKNTTFYGGPSYEVATPIDYVTDNFRFGGEFAKGRFFLAASVDFSEFKNEVPFVEIDNPQRLEMANPTNGRNIINDAAFFRLWMPPDNEAYQADFTGGITLPARHKVTGSLSTGNMKMDTVLRELSTNPNLQTSATAPNPAFSIIPPYSNIEAQYDTFMAQVRFTGDPVRWLGYNLSYRKFELEDKTEHYSFPSTVRGDVGASVPATPYVREHEGWGIESTRALVYVTPVRGLRLGVSYGQDKRTYDIREYADVEDDVWTLSADYNSSLFQLHGAWSSLDRKPGEGNEDAIPPSWQGATQTDITERKRHILSGIATFTPTAKLAISLNGARTENEFAESVTGLLDQSFNTVGVDVTYAANDKVNLMAGYVYETYFFDMAAAYIPRGLSPPFEAGNLWGNQTDDKVDTFRAALDWALVPDKFDLGVTFDYTKPRSESVYDFAEAGTPIGGLNEANGVFPANVPPVPGFPVTTFDRFPTVTKKFIMAKIRLAYHFTKNLSASAMYWKQKYDNTDWQTENPGANGEPYTPYMGKTDPGSNRWFFLGAQVPSYDANIFRASLTYTF
ncbi:MAG TPA: MtrB/PioB family outer membrane beta-barrel protein [Vicinamibacteria bacterium]|nr:MtrB/PioB family outer membrane beta-barrel protein [Vicinamibacteria bacterium]